MIRDKILIMILVTPFFLVMPACNPVSENVDDPLWDSQHNEKPFKSTFFHSADYRFPHGACDEAQCHGTSLEGGNSGAPDCLKCHDNQWTIFGATHKKKISGSYHSIHIDDSLDVDDNTHWLDNCKTCHGGSLTGAGSIQDPPVADNPYRYSCIESQCHDGFTAGKVPPPGHNDKRGSGWHRSGGSCEGAACHGNDGESSTAASGLFAGGRACDSPGCHDGDK